MDRFVERCSGLDVHKDSITATVCIPGPGGQRLQETRTFSATTRGLLTLADWLSSYGVTVVGMESTGCYWKPVYCLLEESLPCRSSAGDGAMSLGGIGASRLVGCRCS